MRTFTGRINYEMTTKDVLDCLYYLRGYDHLILQKKWFCAFCHFTLFNSNNFLGLFMCYKNFCPRQNNIGFIFVAICKMFWYKFGWTKIKVLYRKIHQKGLDNELFIIQALLLNTMISLFLIFVDIVINYN